jgi:chromosome partitioning protein
MIIPTIMEDKPIQGVYGMIQLWMQESTERSKNSPINLIGILPNMFKKTSLHQAMYESIENNATLSRYLLPTKIGHRVVFAETDTQDPKPKSIFDLPDSDMAKQEALSACQLIAERIFGNAH